MTPDGRRSAYSSITLQTCSAKDIEFQFFKFRDNDTYRPWWTGKRLFRWLHAMPEDNIWNCFMCCIALLAIVWTACNLDHFYVDCMDVLYNVVYGVHVLAVACGMIFTTEVVHTNYITWTRFSVDVASYANLFGSHKLKLILYYSRLHRPLQFLWDLGNRNLVGSVVGTALKYSYIFSVLRVTLALVWLYVEEVDHQHNIHGHHHQLHELGPTNVTRVVDSTANEFLKVFYEINKKFTPIGPSVAPWSDFKRIASLFVMIIGCLVVTGAAVASLSIVISLYMSPVEAFRSRYRLIMKEMSESHVPISLREKVETFYKMYWHKQRAVSATQLLPTYPPTLPAMIYSDIYFEAMQKSRILSELTYEFLSEVAKKMHTVHYIPGDPIIKRSSKKSSIIYITYGDIEMLTAEDDSTAILRMTRGTVLAPCAGSVAAGCGRAHVQIRAATFCTAHVLEAGDLWRVALKYGRITEQKEVLLAAFYEHFEKVKRHFYQKTPNEARYKSSILHFKRDLMALKEARDSRGNLLLANPEIFLEIAGCYIMRNTSDATSTDDEADAICLRSTFPCILQPDSSLQVVWRAFVCCVIFAVCITHPYYLVFKKDVPAEFRCFDYVVTAIYALDLIVHLSTGANVEEGVPITFTQTSSQQMRSHWFVLDVLSTMPIFEFIGAGHFAGINKLLRLPKVFYMLKSLEEVCVYHNNVLRFISYSLFLLISCYLIAAMQQGFMCFQLNRCLVKNFTHSPFWKEEPLDEDTITDRLTFGLYWAVSMFTFTSHMDMPGLMKWDNLLYTIFMLEIFIVLHIFVEAVYSATIMVSTMQRENYDAAIGDVKNFLMRNDIDPVLMQRFINYLQLCWYTDKAYSMTHKKKSIFHDLPPHVYQDIVARQRSKHILNIPFMKLLHKEDLKHISCSARLFYTSPNEILLNTGDITNEIYIIKQGICEILNPLTKQVVGALGVKSHFGVPECLLRLPAFYTVRAVTHVQIVSVSKKMLARSLDIPQIKSAIKLCKEQPEYVQLQRRHDSFLCYKLPEPAPNTERFRLPRKYERDDEFLRPFKRLGYLSVLRYIFPRFTIRPDGRYLIRYEWLRAVCALSSAMFFPSYTYLVLQWPSLTFTTFILDISAYYDIIQRMLVGYFNELGLLVYHPYSTATHYLKGAFFIDLFACLPLEYLESPLRERFENYHKLTQARQLLMMNRLIQLYRLPNAILSLTGYIERRDIHLVIHAIPLLLALLNVLTSFVVFYSVDIFTSVDQTSYRIVPINDKGGSWINLFHKAFRFNMTETPWNLHLGSYFWVVYETTTTGYNCFNPSNFGLMRVLFAGMVIGAMITTYFSVRIISIRSNVNKPLAAYQEHMKDMAAYMHRENIDRKLRQEVMNYYEFNWDKMGGVDYTKVLKLCNQITLRTDAILHIYGPTFAMCPFLANCDVSLLRIVGRALQSLYVLRDMAIVEDRDVISDLYFVNYGSVDARATVGDRSTVCRLRRGSVFGNLDAEATVSSSVTFVANCRTHLLKIKSTTFHQILADFPSIQQLMQKYRSEQHYILGSLDDPLRSKEKRLTSTLASQSRSHKGLVKYLYVKDHYIQMYLILVSLLSVHTDVYNAGFQDNRLALFIVLYVLDVAFGVKLLIQYLLPYIVQSSHLRKVLSPLRKQYFQGDFKYDLISCLPLELLCFLADANRGMAFSCLRLNRFFRIVTVYTCLKRRNKRLTINLTLATVFSVLVWFTLFIHTTTCIWYFIGVLEEKAQHKSSWLYNDAGDSWCHSHYVCSMYFVLTTFTQNGVGDIMPKKQSEVVFVCALQMLSTLVYMVYVGEFSNIIQYRLFRSFSFYIQYLELQEFMKNNRVSRNLVGLVNRYSLHLWRESRGLQVPHFLSDAPPCIKLRIMSAAYLSHFTEHPLFKECEPPFLRQLVGHLQLYHYNKGMYVVKEMEITDSMYIIHTGKVLELTDKGGSSTIFTAGQYFGQMEGIFQNTPFTHSYRTLMKSQVLTLHFQDWEYLLKHFPKSRRAIYRRFDDDADSNKPEEGMDAICRALAPSSPYRWSSTKLTATDHAPSPPPSHLSSPSVVSLPDSPNEPSAKMKGPEPTISSTYTTPNFHSSLTNQPEELTIGTYQTSSELPLESLKTSLLNTPAEIGVETTPEIAVETTANTTVEIHAETVIKPPALTSAGTYVQMAGDTITRARAETIAETSLETIGVTVEKIAVEIPTEIVVKTTAETIAKTSAETITGISILAAKEAPAETTEVTSADITADVNEETSSRIATEIIAKLLIDPTTEATARISAQTAAETETMLTTSVSQIRNLYTSAKPAAETANLSETVLTTASQTTLEGPHKVSTMQRLFQTDINPLTVHSEIWSSKESDDSASSIQTLETRNLLDRIKGEHQINKHKAISNTASVLTTLSEREPLSGPRDVDEALKTSNTFIEKAKRIFKPKRISISSDKDTMLIEEDEAATRELMKEVEKNSDKLTRNVISKKTADSIKFDEKHRQTAETAPFQSTMNTQEISQTTTIGLGNVIEDDDFPETLNIKEPDKKDQATSTSRLSRRFIHVRYEDDKTRSIDKKNLSKTDDKQESTQNLEGASTSEDSDAIRRLKNN